MPCWMHKRRGQATMKLRVNRATYKRSVRQPYQKISEKHANIFLGRIWRFYLRRKSILAPFDRYETGSVNERTLCHTKQIGTSFLLLYHHPQPPKLPPSPVIIRTNTEET
uniref:Uncharacterized protein n=1 Tax=Vespula pensylvanica TaxID=30213 RepID=A0A834JU63_VESPE|nr:hypothetical protein H0235_017027 [Vespula pensylvanica]